MFVLDRSEKNIKVIEAYLRATKQLRDFDEAGQDPIFSETVTLDLSTVVSSVSGPKRPNDRVSVSEMKVDFASCLKNKVGFKGFDIAPAKLNTTAKFSFEGKDYQLKHGSVVIAAITSCTNTSKYVFTHLTAKNVLKTFKYTLLKKKIIITIEN